jgi:hypothetical protein
MTKQQQQQQPYPLATTITHHCVLPCLAESIIHAAKSSPLQLPFPDGWLSLLHCVIRMNVVTWSVVQSTWLNEMGFYEVWVTDIRWLVLNLHFGRHVSSHEHLVKGINTTPSFTFPTWVLYRAELVFYWMPMCPYSPWCWCMGQSTNSVHPLFWVLGFSKYWSFWVHMIGWGSIQCQIQLAWFISLQQRSVTH